MYIAPINNLKTKLNMTLSKKNVQAENCINGSKVVVENGQARIILSESAQAAGGVSFAEGKMLAKMLLNKRIEERNRKNAQNNERCYAETINHE